MTNSKISRTPPAAVRRQLRQEVGFGCPVKECGNPYLEYHHFDPPWEVEHHHDPERMIALCATHHAKAGAWTVEQTRELKNNPRPETVSGAFEWMREDVLAVVGGNYYYETPNMVTFQGEPLIWFRRDEKGRLLLNMEMLTQAREPRTSLVDNDWIVRGEPEDLASPPNGSSIRVRYGNGDDVSIRFREWPALEALAKAHPRVLVLSGELKFPLVTAEITMEIGGTEYGFTPTETRFGGVTLKGNVMSRCGAGLAI